jgi:SLOG in TRPM, prokaryote
MAETSLRPPVVMVAGATGEGFEPQVDRYRKLLLDAFARFSGTLISGGTEQGVAGIVGALAADSMAIRAIGYVPAGVAGGASVDARYTEIRRTAGDRFTAAQPLQAWVDVIAAGIEPAAVAVLGIGGGEIAALEYRVALALGAPVGLVAGSGAAADELLAVAPAGPGAAPVRLPPDAGAIADFVGGRRPATG